jgi:hypothetical protein
MKPQRPQRNILRPLEVVSAHWSDTLTEYPLKDITDKIITCV